MAANQVRLAAPSHAFIRLQISKSKRLVTYAPSFHTGFSPPNLLVVPLRLLDRCSLLDYIKINKQIKSANTGVETEPPPLSHA
jgi:hypothetical protein